MASSSSSNQYAFPEALLQQPRCLVALAGLDVKNNAVHRVVWDMFTTGSRGGDKRPAVAYKHVRADYLYPKRNDDAPSSSDSETAPAGILKHNWVKKHSQELPALVVFFFDLEWDEPQWEEKVTECASKVKVIRAALDGRHTELAVALIQTNKPRTTPQGGYDTHTTELANQLCNECDIIGPSLYILPFVDRPEGYVAMLENNFYEQAIRYYGNKIKRIKAKDSGGKPHPMLSIRRQFKTAFFFEYKQDSREALKLYQSAYRLLTEIMLLGEDRIMEFKIMAGYLNYKICRLMFSGQHEDPRSAPPQFQKHIDLFREEKGMRELVFEHHNWMAQQYNAFGDLFSEAVRRNLNPIQTLHPGIHYHHAVLHILEWKRLQQTVCKTAHLSHSHPLPKLPETSYLGERPWRRGLTDLQPSDSVLRKTSITLLQAMEYDKDLSLEAVLPLTKAMEQFKRHKADQMMQHLKVLLGQEYYTANEFEKSLTMLEVAVKMYRNQRWYQLLATIHKTMLRCSYMLGKVYNYITIALEMISRFLPHSEEEKIRIQTNLSLVLNGQVPKPEPGLSRSQIETAEKAWSQQLNVEASGKEKSVDMAGLSNCVECKCVFGEESYTSDNAVQLSVHLRSNAPLPIHCGRLQILLDDKSCSGWSVVDKPFTLKPNTHSTFIFTFPTINDLLQVVAVELKLVGESGEGREITLLWNGGVSEIVSDPIDWAWNRIENRTSTVILPKEATIDLELHHSPPLLLNEYYPVEVALVNREQNEISELSLSAILLDSSKSRGQDSKAQSVPIELYCSLPSKDNKSNPQTSLQLECGSLQPEEEYKTTFYVKSMSIGMKRISIIVSYNVDCRMKEEWKAVKCSCSREDLLSVETVTPLRVKHKLMNMAFQSIDCVFTDEPFLLQTEIHCMSPWQLNIEDSSYQWNNTISIASQMPNQVKNLDLQQQDVASECHCLQASSSAPHIMLGTYNLTWNRSGSSSIPIVTAVPLPQVLVKQLPFVVSAEIPSHAVQHHPVSVVYSIYNKTVYVQEFEAQLVPNNDYMFSGKKLSRFRVLPMVSHTLSFTLFPLTTGHTPLPRLDVSCLSQPKLDQKVSRGVSALLPSSMFVKPSAHSKHTDSPSSSLRSS